MNKRLLWTVFKYLLAAALLAFLVWWYWGRPDNPDDRGLGYVWQRHVVRGEPIDYLSLALAFVFFAAAVPITMVRWWVLVRAQDLPFSLGNAFRLGYLSFFFSTILPGSVGGDLVKAAGIARGQSRRTVAVATVVMDRLIGLWGLFWIVALIGGAFWLAGGLGGRAEGPSKLVVGAALAVTAASVAVWLLMGLLSDARATRLADRLEKLPKVGGSVAELWRAVWMYRQRQGSVFIALVLSLIGFLGFIPSFYFSAAPWPAPRTPTPSRRCCNTSCSCRSAWWCRPPCRCRAASAPANTASASCSAGSAARSRTAFSPPWCSASSPGRSA